VIAPFAAVVRDGAIRSCKPFRGVQAMTFHRSIASLCWLLVGGACFALPTSVAAQPIYKCIGADGAVAFQQTACAPGQREQRVAIEPQRVSTLASAASQASEKTRAPAASRRSTRTAPAEPPSFECRSADGALFYRHSGCPKSIPRRAGMRSASDKGVGTDPVKATRISRHDACRRIGSFGRDGREHDEAVSTYERNAGRDPCRRS
jgi:hypothetical protein